jgi:hypothetical protein
MATSPRLASVHCNEILNRIFTAMTAMYASLSSPTGFHNVAPRTREEREAERNRTDFEKHRIAARVGANGAPPADVVTPVPECAMYQPEHARFAAMDAAAIEQARRREQLEKKEVRLCMPCVVLWMWRATRTCHMTCCIP